MWRRQPSQSGQVIAWSRRSPRPSSSLRTSIPCISNTTQTPHQAARAGLWTNARNCRVSALQRQAVGRIMNVRVKLFAVAKELAGRDELAIDLPAGATVGDLRDAVMTASPALARIVPHSL